MPKWFLIVTAGATLAGLGVQIASAIDQSRKGDKRAAITGLACGMAMSGQAADVIEMFGIKVNSNGQVIG